MSDPLAHGDDEREDLPRGERQMTSADLTAHDGQHGEVRDRGEAEADRPDVLDEPDVPDVPDEPDEPDLDGPERDGPGGV